MVKKIIFSSLLASMLFTACNNADKTPTQATAETAADPTRDIQDAPPPRPNPYWVTIDSMGKITFDGKEMDVDKLQKTLTDSLKSMKKSGHSLPDTIMFRTEGTVMMGIRGAVYDAINDARSAAMKDK